MDRCVQQAIFFPSPSRDDRHHRRPFVVQRISSFFTLILFLQYLPCCLPFLSFPPLCDKGYSSTCQADYLHPKFFFLYLRRCLFRTGILGQVSVLKYLGKCCVTCATGTCCSLTSDTSSSIALLLVR